VHEKPSILAEFNVRQLPDCRRRARSITISGLEATGIYRSALSVESWSDSPITNVVIRNAHLEFSGGGQFDPAAQMVQPPRLDARPLPAWGAYARNVLHFTLEYVRFSLAQDDARPVILADTVARLSLDALKFPRVPGVVNPLVTTNVGKLEMRNTDLSRE
jgi:hypothetical protein